MPQSSSHERPNTLRDQNSSHHGHKPRESTQNTLNEPDAHQESLTTQNGQYHSQKHHSNKPYEQYALKLTTNVPHAPNTSPRGHEPLTISHLLDHLPKPPHHTSHTSPENHAKTSDEPLLGYNVVQNASHITWEKDFKALNEPLTKSSIPDQGPNTPHMPSEENDFRALNEPLNSSSKPLHGSQATSHHALHSASLENGFRALNEPLNRSNVPHQESSHTSPQQKDLKALNEALHRPYKQQQVLKPPYVSHAPHHENGFKALNEPLNRFPSPDHRSPTMPHGPHHSLHASYNAPLLHASHAPNPHSQTLQSRSYTNIHTPQATATRMDDRRRPQSAAVRSPNRLSGSNAGW